MKKTRKEDYIDGALAFVAVLSAVAVPIANAAFKDNQPLISISVTVGLMILSAAVAFVLFMRKYNAKHERTVVKLNTDHDRDVRKLIEDHERTLDSVRLMVSSKNSEIYSIEEALSRVGDNAKKNKIWLIKNISFCTPQNKNDIELRLTNQPWYYAYSGNVLLPLENGTMKFKDLLSPAVASMESHRHKEFMKRVQNQNIYDARVYPFDREPMEFTLLEFVDGRQEVMLGWNYSAETGRPHILALPQKHIFEIFDQEFEKLWRMSKPLSSYKSGRRSMVDEFVKPRDSRKLNRPIKRDSKVKE